MSGLNISLVLAVIALIIAVNAYRDIRHGSTRFYALEREITLRRASFTLLASVFLFVAALALLIYSYRNLQNQPLQADPNAPSGIPTVTPTLFLEIFPPTPTPTGTPDPNIPTPLPTPIIRRGIIENTGGSGAYLRSAPGTNSETLFILDDGTFVTLMDEEPPQEANGYTWLKVRTAGGEQGWVADIFLTVRDR